jgi:hypothetical protein
VARIRRAGRVIERGPDIGQLALDQVEALRRGALDILFDPFGEIRGPGQMVTGHRRRLTVLGRTRPRVGADGLQQPVAPRVVQLGQ